VKQQRKGSEVLRIAKVAGIQLKINNWFILLSIIFVLSGLGIKLLIAFSAVLWHELAHVVVAFHVGLPVREIEILPFGGVATIDRLNEAGTKNEIMIAAAGPTASLVLAAVLYWGMSFLEFRHELLSFCLEINLMLTLFNLLPAFPLDGGKIFRSLSNLYYSYEQATTYMIRLTKIISWLLVIRAVYEYILFSTVNITFVIAAIFLYTAASAEGKVMSFRRMKVLAGKKTELILRGIMPTMHFTAVTSVCVNDILRLFGPSHYYIVLVINEKSQIQGTLTETEIWEGLTNKGIYASIGQFLD
jgi:stage IV sporulation protein FB